MTLMPVQKLSLERETQDLAMLTPSLKHPLISFFSNAPQNTCWGCPTSCHTSTCSHYSTTRLQHRVDRICITQASPIWQKKKAHRLEPIGQCSRR